jgi:phosphotransferase system IIB component
MELMKSMGKLKSKVEERSKQNMEPTSKDEGRKKVMKRNNGKFVPIILGVAWRYILVNVHRDVHSPLL